VIGIVFQNNLKKAGINAIIDKKDGREASKIAKTKNFEIYVGGSNLDIGLVDLKQHFHTVNDVPGGTNIMGFGNEKTDALIDKIRETVDETKRNQLYKEMQKVIYEQQPAIYLFSPRQKLAIHKRFEASTSAKKPTYHVNFEVESWTNRSLNFQLKTSNFQLKIKKPHRHQTGAFGPSKYMDSGW